MPSFHLGALAKTHWTEYLIRFAFGGAVTVATGLIAKAHGPAVGGLFLAFPAILPASLTLLKEHDGRAQAVQAAAGSRLGAVGLIAFAATATALSRFGAEISLVGSSAAWAILSLVLWKTVYDRETYSLRGEHESRRPRRGSKRRR